MKKPAEIVPGVIFFSYLASMRKEKVAFLQHSTLVLQVSGRFTMNSAGNTVSMGKGGMLLIQKNQLAEIIKTPLEDECYQTIVIFLLDELLRKIALEERIEIEHKYRGPSNILIPQNDFLHAFFQSLIPYVGYPHDQIDSSLGMLKVKEAVYLLMNVMPQLKEFLFDFSEPHKIDLEKFMQSNFHYNLPVEKFAQLTGRSLAAFKRDFQRAFGMAPRHWLQERRLSEAKFLIEKKKKKPSAIYLDLGFESLSHFSYSFRKKYGMAPRDCFYEKALNV